MVILMPNATVLPTFVACRYIGTKKNLDLIEVDVCASAHLLCTNAMSRCKERTSESSKRGTLLATFGENKSTTYG